MRNERGTRTETLGRTPNRLHAYVARLYSFVALDVPTLSLDRVGTFSDQLQKCSEVGSARQRSVWIERPDREAGSRTRKTSLGFAARRFTWPLRRINHEVGELCPADWRRLQFVENRVRGRPSERPLVPILRFSIRRYRATDNGSLITCQIHGRNLAVLAPGGEVLSEWRREPMARWRSGLPYLHRFPLPFGSGQAYSSDSPSSTVADHHALPDRIFRIASVGLVSPVRPTGPQPGGDAQ